MDAGTATIFVLFCPPVIALLCVKVKDGDSATEDGGEGGEIEEVLPNNKRHRGIPGGMLSSSSTSNDKTMESVIAGENNKVC